MYNTAAYMPRCLDTLLHQDIPASDYEIILVDDCSTDNSLELANEYASRSFVNSFTPSPLIRVCAHAQNKGLAAARNTGIDAAKGEYLCFVDPDDYIEKNSMSALLKQMDEEQLDMLRFNYQKVDEQYNNVLDVDVEANFDYSPKIMTGTEFLAYRLGVGCYVWAYIYRLAFIRSTGIRFFEGCFFDDTPWLPRILQKAQRINVNPVRHQYYLQRSTSMVHARNSQSVMRKVDTQMQLIDILLEQRIDMPKETYGWYNMMFAQLIVSMLVSIATFNYQQSLDYYSRLRSKGLFPLSPIRAARNTIGKIKWLNTCPRLFLFLIHLKNR